MPFLLETYAAGVTIAGGFALAAMEMANRRLKQVLHMMDWYEAELTSAERRAASKQAEAAVAQVELAKVTRTRDARGRYVRKG